MAPVEIRCEWLADLLADKVDLITQYWIEQIRAEGMAAYDAISDEQLRSDLPPTVQSMIDTFRSGDAEGPRRHSIGVIQRRMREGFLLPDLQMSLHALQDAVMRVVMGAGLSPDKEYEALLAASNVYYGVAVIAGIVYEQLRTEQQKRFTTTYELGTDLSRNLDMRHVLDLAVARLSECVGGAAVAILLAQTDSGQDAVRAYFGVSPEVVEALPSISDALTCVAVDAESPGAHRATYAIPDVANDEIVGQWSDLLSGSGHRAVQCAPLVASQKRLGVLLVMWPDVHLPSSMEVEFLSAMAGHIANAIQNAALYDEAKGKRELGILLNASKLFGSTLDTEQVLRKTARMAAEAARACAALVFIRAGLPRESKVALYLRNRRAARPFRSVVNAVVAEGEASGFQRLGREFLVGKGVLYDNLADFGGSLQSLRAADLAGMVVPLRQNKVLVGAIFLMTMAPNRFTADDLTLATGLADLAAVAIENSRLYEYERNISATLQRSFLPPTLPRIEGYEAAAYYRPAMAEAEIGGDFYDLFSTPDGSMSIVLGDVSGKGLNAAVPTAMAKYMIRAYAAEGLSPGDVMARFNRAFFGNVPDGLFMTAFYGTLRAESDTIIYVSAGHDPPLLYSAASRNVTELDIDGMCVGVLDEIEYADKTVTLEPEDVLLLYTDGATDVRSGDKRLELEGLRKLLKWNARESAQGIVENLSKGILRFGQGKQSDDIALVVLKRTGA